jgi:hypothetical protein
MPAAVKNMRHPALISPEGASQRLTAGGFQSTHWTNDTPSSDVKHCASLKEFSALIIASPVGLT